MNVVCYVTSARITVCGSDLCFSAWSSVFLFPLSQIVGFLVVSVDQLLFSRNHLCASPCCSLPFVSRTSAFLCNLGITAHLPAAIHRPIAHLGSLQSLSGSAKQLAVTLLRFIPHLLCLNTQDSLFSSPPPSAFYKLQ